MPHESNRPILGVIAVSGGDPNLTDGATPALRGRPLLEYTLAAARAATRLDRVIVSTDSEAVAEEARRLGAEVPFMRPLTLANPTAPITEVMRHALTTLEEKEGYVAEWGALLLTTYPFRPRGFIDQFIGTVLDHGFDSAFAALEDRHSQWLLTEQGQPQLVAHGSGTARAQKRESYRELSGLLSMARRPVILSGRMYGDALGIVPTNDMWAVTNVREPHGHQLADVLAPLFTA